MISVVLDNNIIINLEKDEALKTTLLECVKNDKLKVYFTALNFYELIKNVDFDNINQRIRLIHYLYKISKYENFLLLPENELFRYKLINECDDLQKILKNWIINSINNSRENSEKLRNFEIIYNEIENDISDFISINVEFLDRLKKYEIDYCKQPEKTKLIFKKRLKEFLNVNNVKTYNDSLATSIKQIIESSQGVSLDLSNQEDEIVVSFICYLQQHFYRIQYLNDKKLNKSDFFDYQFLYYLVFDDIIFVSEDRSIRNRLKETNHIFLSRKILNLSEFESVLKAN